MKDNNELLAKRRKMNFHENDTISLFLDDLLLLEKFNTERQEIGLYTHQQLGKVLIINGEIQHIENYQCLYHEMLVHLPVSFMSSPQIALIIGGGSLFAAYETLKYSSIKKLILCDYEPKLIEMLESYYPHVKKVLDDPRFQYINMEAKQYIMHTSQKYDLIINDCFNVIKETLQDGTMLIDKLYDLLRDNGICSDIIYRYIFAEDTMKETLRKMGEFDNKCFFLVTVPEYPGVLHIEMLWGKNSYLTQYAKKSINLEQKESITFQYFNPNMLPHYLYLPKYICNLFTK